MHTELLCWILGGLLAGSILSLLIWAAWFFRQWRYLDAVLKMFQDENTWESGFTGAAIDIQETRESRLVSDMQQILTRAAWREKEAVHDKQRVTQLLSDLSHQLKTPLANIILDLSILESGADGMDEGQRQEFLSHAKTQASTMQWLMQELLKAVRLEDGMIQFQAENTYIRPTIAKAVGAVYAQASKKNIEIYVEDTDDLSIFHNPKWTAEAMANVLENAVKYSPRGSQIQIRMERMELYTRVTIKDQGCGIPESDFNQIFQRFYRGQQADTEEGLGLGLYLAQLILQSEQGYLTVESKQDEGSSFHFFLLNNIPHG